MQVRLGVAVVLLWMVMVGPCAEAQSAQPWSLQASLLAAGQNLNGGLVSGVGFEGQVRYAPSAGRKSLGLGVQYSKHKDGDQSIAISGVFLEPRIAFDVGSARYAPYLAGRIAVLHLSAKLQDPNSSGSDLLDVSSNGFAVGGGGGVVIKATNTINIDIGAAVVVQSLADAKGAGLVIGFSPFANYVAKAGFSFGFGG